MPTAASIIWYFVHFTPNRITRPATTVTAWISELDDKVWNYAMKDDAAVITSPR
jgi:hypothetical protein